MFPFFLNKLIFELAERKSLKILLLSRVDFNMAAACSIKMAFIIIHISQLQLKLVAGVLYSAPEELFEIDGKNLHAMNKFAEIMMRTPPACVAQFFHLLLKKRVETENRQQ